MATGSRSAPGAVGPRAPLMTVFLVHSASPSATTGAYALALERRPSTPMKLKIRNSKSKKAKKTGFLSRQRTSGGRKVNKRQRSRHGSF